MSLKFSTIMILTTIYRSYSFRLATSRFLGSQKLQSSSSNEPGNISYKVALMFPGQGAQAVGMAKDLCEKNEIAKSLFDKVINSTEFLKHFCYV